MVLEAHALTKRFGDRTVVEEVSFGLGSGRIVGFLGPNGAGKTTTLRMILGLTRPTSGCATINGVVFGQLKEPGHVVGAVLEKSGFTPARSGENHLRGLAAALGVSRRTVTQTLERVDLAEAARRPVQTYSLGMRQRLGIAAALLGEPEVLVLDEPTNGLDPPAVRWLRDLLRAHAAAGGSVLVSSHVLAEVAHVVDDVIVLEHGRVLAQGPISALTARQAPAVRLRSPELTRLAVMLERAGVTVELTGPDALIAHGVSNEQVGDLLRGEQIAVYEMAVHASTLEDVFFDLLSPPGGRAASPLAI
jgi:ABC-2 type transport system ATP-binding protein